MILLVIVLFTGVLIGDGMQHRHIIVVEKKELSHDHAPKRDITYFNKN